MKNYIKICVILSNICLLLIGCNEGISPPDSPSVTEAHGISGTIYFSNWPPSDSVVDLRLVAFKNYPPLDIITDVLQGRAKYSEKLSYGVDSIIYTLLLNPIPPDTMRCIAVGQQYGSNIEEDWRLVGLYYNQGDSVLPGRFFVPADSIIPNVNIAVDFNKLPPQP